MTEWSRQRRDSEPEIIPPGPQAPIWARDGGGGYGYSHIRVSRPGPVGLVLLGMALGAGALIVAMLLLGAVLLWLPLIGLLAVTGIIAGALRGPPRRRY